MTACSDTPVARSQHPVAAQAQCLFFLVVIIHKPAQTGIVSALTIRHALIIKLCIHDPVAVFSLHCAMLEALDGFHCVKRPWTTVMN